MNRQIIISASLLGLLAVIAGAFGAHGLKALIGMQQLEIWHTAVEYQFYHVLALLFLSTFNRPGSKFIRAAYYLFIFGIILFSGSLYLLACRNIIAWKSLYMVAGPVTPIGGLLFIIGWLMLALAAIRNK